MAAACARLGAFLARSGALVRYRAGLGGPLPGTLQRSALNIPYQIRNASGLGAQLCRPVRLSASTALPQAFGNSTTTQNTSILNRIAPLLPSMVHHPVRSLTYFGLRSGKRKTVKSVTDRFLRLHCGLWVRRKAGYKKKLWKKSAARKKRLREHVFCNKTQNKLLDKMTTSFWKSITTEPISECRPRSSGLLFVI
uniref:Large ribosomal subunit protein bL35m n=1 Tax=Xenopus tropicalis TaxID=8364 RepID=A0A6I8SXQ7_XENTR